MFIRIRDAVLLLRRFPQLLVLPVVLWLSELPLGLIVPGWNESSGTVEFSGTTVARLGAMVPWLTGFGVLFMLFATFLQAGQIHGIMIAFNDQRLTWYEYWAVTRRHGLRVIGLSVLFILMLIAGFLFASFLFNALKLFGILLAALTLIVAASVYGLALLLLIRDNLTAGDALGAAWRFIWAYRGVVGAQLLAVFLCSLGVALLVSLISHIPGGDYVGGLLSSLTTSLLPLVILAGLLRTHPVPPRSEAPPSPF